MEPYRPTLAVHLIWHPRFAAGEAYGQAMFARLFEDPDDLASHGMRIPVRLWRSRSTDDEPPPPTVPPLDEARRNAVVVLIDDEFLAADGWPELLDDLVAAASAHDQTLLAGAALTEVAAELDSAFLERNLIRLWAVQESLREAVLLNRVTHALCRLASGEDASARVFISHAKHDGVAIAEQVRAFLESGTGVEHFFDAQHIREGDRWAQVLHGAAADNVLLAIRTDAYATREWCRTEVLDAKRGGSPVVVLDALNDQEPRGFPYLGNAPSVRYRGGDPAALEELLGVILRETLRFRHFPLRVDDVCNAYGRDPETTVLSAPPELLTLLPMRDAERLVYPDPPLGRDELTLVAQIAPRLTPLTPTELVARR